MGRQMAHVPPECQLVLYHRLKLYWTITMNNPALQAQVLKQTPKCNVRLVTRSFCLLPAAGLDWLLLVYY